MAKKFACIDWWHTELYFSVELYLGEIFLKEICDIIKTIVKLWNYLKCQFVFFHVVNH